jgi:hypothetical protein
MNVEDIWERKKKGRIGGKWRRYLEIQRLGD